LGSGERAIRKILSIRMPQMKHEASSPVRRAKRVVPTNINPDVVDKTMKASKGLPVRPGGTMGRPPGGTRWPLRLLRIAFALAMLMYLFLFIAYLPEKFRQFGIAVGLVGVVAVLLCMAEHCYHVCMATGDFFGTIVNCCVQIRTALDGMIEQMKRLETLAYGAGERIHRFIEDLFG
jgi:hypothetical protein